MPLCSEKTSKISKYHWTAYMNTISFNGFVLSEGKKGVQKLPFGRDFMKTRWTGALTKTVPWKYQNRVLIRQDGPKLTSVFSLWGPLSRIVVDVRFCKITKVKQSGARVFSVSKTMKKASCNSAWQKKRDFLGKVGGGTLPFLAGNEGTCKLIWKSL